MAPSANSEDALSNTLDSCVADTIIKIGTFEKCVLTFSKSQLIIFF
jgi:hypothetical protein